jgi:xanthine dehydrogenase YagT iron-sulfur-binding subunit
MKEETDKLDLTEDEKKLFEDLMPEDLEEILKSGVNRRHFLKLITLAGGGLMAYQLLGAEQLLARSFDPPPYSQPSLANIENAVEISFKINGSAKKLTVDSRMTLLDTLRERLQLTGSKKGCDHGQCGACTVIVDGERILSCLTLAATCSGKEVTSIEGIATGNKLHPVQEAFLKNDGFQCGFCTPGQICSAVALMKEAKNGDASYLTSNLRSTAAALKLSDDEIRERMSGNICRCGAYPNIIAAIQEVHSGKGSEEAWQFVG